MSDISMNPIGATDYSPVSLDGQSTHESTARHTPITQSQHSIPSCWIDPSKLLLVCAVSTFALYVILSFRASAEVYSSHYSTLLCGGISTDHEEVTSLNLFQSATGKDDVFLFVPKRYLDSHEQFLLVDQITQGVGMRSLYFDAGRLLFQREVSFERRGEKNVAIVSSSPFHRPNTTDVRISFSGNLLAILSISVETENGVFLSYSVSSFPYLNYIYEDSLTSQLGTSFTFSAPDSLLSTVNCLSGLASAEVRYSFSSKQLLPISFALRRSIFPIHQDGECIYAPRIFHPRSGFNSISYANESSSLFEPRNRHYITRHQILKEGCTDLGNVKPILFYLDPNIPEIYRNAVLEGIQWWDAAFQYAGFPKGTIATVVADKNVDLFDVSSVIISPLAKQYSTVNFVHWIHRDYRGYSVGERITDLENGKIFSGHVRIESLRMRQDALIALSLLVPNNESNVASIFEETTQFIINRVRALAAHEVGHALGLAHNFAGSSASPQPKSVMDYPAPIVSIDESTGHLYLNNMSYPTDIGIFDKVAVDFAYHEFSNQELRDSQENLQKGQLVQLAANISLSPEMVDYFLAKRRLELSETKGSYIFLSDDDIDGGDWIDSQWDSGVDPIAALNKSLLVREIGLANLPRSVLLNPHSSDVSAFLSLNPTSNILTDIFPIIWLWHRYEVKAVARLIGGYSFSYSMAGDIFKNRTNIPEAIQFSALDALLLALERKSLTIPQSVSKILGPIAFGFQINPIGGIEDTIQGRISSREFDPVVAVETASSLVIGEILQPSILERVTSRMSCDCDCHCMQISVSSIIFRIISKVFANETFSGSFVHSVFVPQYILVNTLLRLLQNDNNRLSPVTLAQIQDALEHLRSMLRQELEKQTSSSFVSSKNLSATTLFTKRQSKWRIFIGYLLEKIDTKTPFVTEMIIPMGGPI